MSEWFLKAQVGFFVVGLLCGLEAVLIFFGWHIARRVSKKHLHGWFAPIIAKAILLDRAKREKPIKRRRKTKR